MILGKDKIIFLKENIINHILLARYRLHKGSKEFRSMLLKTYVNVMTTENKKRK